jgi:predicted GNAT family N-acyltransferase
MLSPLENRNLTLPVEMTMESFVGREVPEVLREIESLRVRVWRDTGFTIKPGHEQDTHWGDDWDAECTHFAVRKNGTLIAATRVSTHHSIESTPYPEWFPNLSPEPHPPLLYISRLVVDQTFKRQKLGDLLDLKCIQLGRYLGAGAILCDVPEYRIEPLQRRGFILTCEPKLGVLFPTMRFSGMILRLE